LSRQEAYELVQRNAMKAWKQKTGFLNLLKADTKVTAQLSGSELEALFNYSYFIRHVDEVFERLGLTEKRKGKAVSGGEPAPQPLRTL